MSPDEYCRQKAAPEGSALHYSLRSIDPERRQAATAIYALWREVNDGVEECSEAQVAHAKLGWWRAEIAGLLAGNPRHPVTRALHPHLAPLNIGAERLNEIIGGVEMGLAQARYLDFAGLEHYCRHSGGAAAVAAAGIFGHTEARTLEYALQLGIALQLGEILCAVGEDARRNRIFLPMDELKRFDVPASDLLQARASDGFLQLMKFQLERVNAIHEKALAALPPADRRAQRPGLIMAAIQRATLAEIEREGFKVLTQRTSLTPLRKLWIAWKTR